MFFVHPNLIGFPGIENRLLHPVSYCDISNSFCHFSSSISWADLKGFRYSNLSFSCFFSFLYKKISQNKIRQMNNFSNYNLLKFNKKYCEYPYFRSCFKWHKSPCGQNPCWKLIQSRAFDATFMCGKGHSGPVYGFLKSEILFYSFISFKKLSWWKQAVIVSPNNRRKD